MKLSSVRQKISISKNRMVVGGRTASVSRGQRRVGVNAATDDRRFGLLNRQKQQYLTFFFGRQQLGLSFIKKLRYRCLCLWISKAPFAFIRFGLKNKVDRWSVSKKNHYMRCCQNPLWCGNVFNNRRVYKKGRNNKIVEGRFVSRISLRVRSKLFYENSFRWRLGSPKLLRFVGELLPYSSDFKVNPLFKNYMRFSRCFGEVGGRSDKVNGWLRLMLYRKLRFRMYRANLVEQFFTQLYIRRERLSNILNNVVIHSGGFISWFRFYLNKRWWKPGLFR